MTSGQVPSESAAPLEPSGAFVDPERWAAVQGLKGGVDDEATQLAKARARKAMFGEEVPELRIGRYVVLRRVGAGAMGVVYAAYDPELDRKVAIKLLHRAGYTSDSEGARRLLREARSLAQLNHPNVVAVHDVGEVDGRVFVAMEFVDGDTMRAWLEHSPRPWRDVVRMFAATGRGLAAAHAKGLVHRDFKPDNVMLAADGRVLVTDFGLARRASDHPPEASTDATIEADEHLTQRGALVGTPAYMSPEQYLGEEVGPKSDQFSFCVALYEACYRQRPFASTSLSSLADAVLRGEVRPPPVDAGVPPWIRRIILRGLASDPAERHPSMDALLAALADDPTRRRVRRMALAGATIVAASSLVVWQVDRRRREAACAEEAASITEIWGDDTRPALHEAVLATQLSYAADTWDRLQPRLDEYAAQWSELRGRVCREADLEGTRTSAQRALVDECLDDRAWELEAMGRLLGPPHLLTRAVQTAARLPSIADCADDTRLARRVPPPDDPEVHARVRALRRRIIDVAATNEQRDAGTLAQLQEALSEAESIGWAPLVAEARYLLGAEQHEDGEYEAARTTLEAAWLEATATGQDEVAVDAARALSHVVGSGLARNAEAVVWATVAAGQLAHHSADDHVRLAEVESDLADLARDRGDTDGAMVHAERALELLDGNLDEIHPDLAAAVGLVAQVHASRGEHVLALAAYHRALALTETIFGPNHPNMAVLSNNLGLLQAEMEDFDGAVVSQRRTIEIFEGVLPPGHPNLGHAWSNLGILQSARRSFDEAIECQTRALAILEPAIGADHVDLAYPLLGIGLAYVDTSRPERAIEPMERALKLRQREDTAPNLIAEAQYGLARALWDSRKDPARARVLGQAARDGFERAGEGHEGNVATVQEWLDEIDRQ